MELAATHVSARFLPSWKPGSHPCIGSPSTGGWQGVMCARVVDERGRLLPPVVVTVQIAFESYLPGVTL